MKPTIPDRSVADHEKTSEDPDDQAMRAMAEGDGIALQVIFDRWKLPMINFLYRSLGCHADAEDIALEVFEEVWRSASRYRAEGTFSAWLFAIARGRILHELRRRRRKPVTAAPMDFLESTEEDGRKASERTEREEVLLAALEKLPEAQRSALLLTIQTPMDSEQIALTLGVKTSHLYVLIHRGRARLREMLEERL